MSHEHTPFGWPALITSLTGAGITISQVNQWVTFFVGIATLVFTIIKIVQAINGAARDREVIKKLYARMTPTKPADLEKQ